MESVELSGRKKEILKAIVELYVDTAEPVGSKAIAAALTSRVSSATIRHEMAELEEWGYLEKPHTSAGRIPSPKCYRIYVNELMEQQRLSLRETESINRALRMQLQELDRVLLQVGRIVSHFMQYPVYALAEGKSRCTVTRYDLLYVDAKSFIAVLMTEDRQVKSRLLRAQMQVEEQQMPALSELLNREFTGQPREELSVRLMAIAPHIPAPLFLMLSAVVEYAGEVLDAMHHRMVYTAGTGRILDLPEYKDVGRASELMNFLSEENAELPEPEDDGRLKILIGPENVASALQSASVMVASCDIGSDMRGLIGVVGPTRMDYATVAARLTYFATAMTRLFDRENGLKSEEDVKS